MRELFKFKEKDYGHEFVYSNNETPCTFGDFPHTIYLDDANTTRNARILKTVAYVAVDENEFGQPVVERWQIINRGRIL
jgi:hypothetical protein